MKGIEPGMLRYWLIPIGFAAACVVSMLVIWRLSPGVGSGCLPTGWIP